jgi:hypothetical protein
MQQRIWQELCESSFHIAFFVYGKDQKTQLNLNRLNS